MTPDELHAELTKLAPGDPILAGMLRDNLPLSRRVYVALAWGGEPPEHWTAEHELEIPEPLRTARG